MNQKSKSFLFFFIGAMSAFVLMYLFNNFNIEKKTTETPVDNTSVSHQNSTEMEKTTSYPKISSDKIEDLTEEEVVVEYVKKNGTLPDYYITKNEARKAGWIASEGNLCEVLPGKAIGGDRFGNREGKLPKGGKYFEADINYDCGNRDADRIVFNSEGEVWVTHDHYKTFEKQ